MDQNKKYLTPLKGKRTKNHNVCPHCGSFLNSIEGDGYDNSIGFHDMFMVIRCPYCFEYFYYHGDYDTFLMTIREELNKYFSNNEE